MLDSFITLFLCLLFQLCWSSLWNYPRIFKRRWIQTGHAHGGKYLPELVDRSSYRRKLAVCQLHMGSASRDRSQGRTSANVSQIRRVLFPDRPWTLHLPTLPRRLRLAAYGYSSSVFGVPLFACCQITVFQLRSYVLYKLRGNIESRVWKTWSKIDFTKNSWIWFHARIVRQVSGCAHARRTSFTTSREKCSHIYCRFTKNWSLLFFNLHRGLLAVGMFGKCMFVPRELYGFVGWTDAALPARSVLWTDPGNGKIRNSGRKPDWPLDRIQRRVPRNCVQISTRYENYAHISILWRQGRISVWHRPVCVFKVKDGDQCVIYGQMSKERILHFLFIRSGRRKWNPGLCVSISCRVPRGKSFRERVPENISQMAALYTVRTSVRRSDDEQTVQLPVRCPAGSGSLPCDWWNLASFETESRLHMGGEHQHRKGFRNSKNIRQIFGGSRGVHVRPFVGLWINRERRNGDLKFCENNCYFHSHIGHTSKSMYAKYLDSPDGHGSLACARCSI